jgi:hypothetical protein
LTGKNPSRTGFSSVRSSSLVTSSPSFLISAVEVDDPCTGSTKEFDLELEFATGLTTSTPTMPSPTLPFLDPSSNGVTISSSTSIDEGTLFEFRSRSRFKSSLKTSSKQRKTGG